MGTHLRVFSESYPMDTNMTGFRWFSKILRSCALDDSIVSALEGLNQGRFALTPITYCIADEPFLFFVGR